MPGPIRPPNPSKQLALDVSNSRVDGLKDFDGMAMEAEIALNNLGPEPVQRKQVSNFKWTPGRATVGLGMGKGMCQWIQKSFDGNHPPTNGSLILGDSNFKAQSRLDFEDATLTSVTVPKLDGSSKEAAYFNIEFEPGRVRYSKAGGEDMRTKIGTKQKAWLRSNFRIEIGSLPCIRIASVESFTWKCTTLPEPTGMGPTQAKAPGRIAVPDLTLTISMADHAAWAEAARKWFIDGEHNDANEMSGRIVFLAPNLKEELGEISLRNVGFKRFSLIASEGAPDAISRFNVDLYVEKMDFKIGAYGM